jgi:hypothetical protein
MSEHEYQESYHFIISHPEAVARQMTHLIVVKRELEVRVKELEEGLAVRWRPISEVPPYQRVSVWVPASAGRNGHIRHNTIWCADKRKWVDALYDALEVQPTHFILLSALGEPNNAES